MLEFKIEEEKYLISIFIATKIRIGLLKTRTNKWSILIKFQIKTFLLNHNIHYEQIHTKRGPMKNVRNDILLRTGNTYKYKELQCFQVQGLGLKLDLFSVVWPVLFAQTG